MSQNIYDNPVFFEAYSKLNRSVDGLKGAPEWPSIVEMLPKLDGLNIIDLGCGYGWFCRYARQNGAKQVLGLDISEKMLAKARDMTVDSAITYFKQDLETLKLPEQTYDLAYSSLTLHYIEDLPSLLETIYKSLKPGSYFVFTAEHPIYTSPKRPGWIIDSEHGHKSWPVNNYQAQGKRVINWLTEGVIKQHRLMSTYLNMLIDTRFVIKQINEWGPTSQQILENPLLDEEKERPMIFIMSVQKPSDK